MPAEVKAEISPHVKPAGRAKRGWLPVLIILLLTFIVYAPAAANEFAMDDEPLVQSTRATHDAGPDPVIKPWNPPWFYFARYYWWSESANDGLYRPVTVWSYALVYKLISEPFLAADAEPYPQHAVNILLHLWCTFLVFKLLLSIGASRLVALASMAIFGLHALHSEAVASIVGRAELFAFGFGVQAVLLLQSGLERTGRRRMWRVVAASSFLFLACCSKEIGLAWLPFVPCLLLTKAWLEDCSQPIGAILRRDLWTWLLVAAVPAILFFLCRAYAMQWEKPHLGGDYMQNPLLFVSFAERFFSAIKVWGFGLYKCFWAYPMVCIYSPNTFSIISSPVDPGFLGAFVALVGFAVAGLWWARRAPLLFMSMAVFLGFSFITSNVPIGTGTIFGERTYYTPSLGISVLIAWSASVVSGRARLIALGLLAIWLAANAFFIAERNPDWKNNKTLFLTDVQVNTEAADLHRKAAAVYEEDLKDNERALESIMRAVEIDPQYVLGYRDMAQVYTVMGRLDDARKAWESALACPKDRLDASGAEPFVWNGLGRLADRQKKPDLALQHFKKSLEISPRQNNDAVLAVSELGIDKLPRSYLQKMFYDVGPTITDPKAKVSLGVMALKIGLPAAHALEALRVGVANYPQKDREQPRFKQAMYYLGAAHEFTGRVDLARQIWQQLLRDANTPPGVRAAAEKALRNRKP